MASPVQHSGEQQAPAGGLVQLFLAADAGIERRRTENIFKQLDERNLTEEEELIIQQRVDLQRKLLREYEKREQSRKVNELQDLWPDLSEAAALRALDLCSGKEDDAVLRLTEDSAFRRKVMAETSTYTPTVIVPGPRANSSSRASSNSSSRLRSDRHGSSGSKVLSPSKLDGNVFVGRFRSKLGPYQERALADAVAAAQAAAGRGAAAAGQPMAKRRGRPKKRPDMAAAAAAAAATAVSVGLGSSSSSSSNLSRAAVLGAARATTAAAAAGGGAAAAGDLASATATDAATAAVPQQQQPNQEQGVRHRSSSPCTAGSEEGIELLDTEALSDSGGVAAGAGAGAATSGGVEEAVMAVMAAAAAAEEEEAAAEEEAATEAAAEEATAVLGLASDYEAPAAADAATATTTATATDGNETDGVVQRQDQQPPRQQQQQQVADSHAAAAERVISMMGRQIARLEPLVAAGRLLDFEVRRPGSSGAVLELLAVEHGPQVAGPIATAWEVLIEEQKWKEAEELAAYEASRGKAATGAAAAATGETAATTAPATPAAGSSEHVVGPQQQQQPPQQQQQQQQPPHQLQWQALEQEQQLQQQHWQQQQQQDFTRCDYDMMTDEDIHPGALILPSEDDVAAALAAAAALTGSGAPVEDMAQPEMAGSVAGQAVRAFVGETAAAAAAGDGCCGIWLPQDQLEQQTGTAFPVQHVLQQHVSHGLDSCTPVGALAELKQQHQQQQEAEQQPVQLLMSQQQHQQQHQQLVVQHEQQIMLPLADCSMQQQQQQQQLQQQQSSQTVAPGSGVVVSGNAAAAATGGDMSDASTISGHVKSLLAAAAAAEAATTAAEAAAAATTTAAEAAAAAATTAAEAVALAAAPAAAAGACTGITAAEAAAAAGIDPAAAAAGIDPAAAAMPVVVTPLRRGSRRAASKAVAAATAAVAAATDDGAAGGSRSQAGGRSAAGRTSSGGLRASRAISETGHTCRGRVRQKSHKTTELVQLGELVPRPEWYNAGYIFPAGFKSRLLFRSSVDLDALTLHECEIVGEGGKFWPAPTFVVTARDREEEPIVAKSCTGCWSGILKRINAVITKRRAEGENLPPPPRTAIAGPEYFGLNDLATIAAIEALDPQHLCTTYWIGKEQREAAAAGMPVAVQPRAAAAATAAAAAAGAGGGNNGGGGGRKRGRPRGGAGAAAAAGDGDADDEGSGYRGAHWSSISRRERYIKRCTEAGDEAPLAGEQDLLPGYLDPITLEPVVNPAISPAGHVMGLATWKAVLAENPRCPFTKAPLRPDMLTVLTANNIEKHRHRILAMS